MLELKINYSLSNMKKLIILFFAFLFFISCSENRMVEKEYYENGKLKSELFLINGKPSKKKDYYENGNLYTEYELNGTKKNGLQKMYFETGNLMLEVELKDDKKNGKFIIYNEDGTILSEEIYKDDIQVK